MLMSDSVDPSWFRIELAPGYFFQDWYNRRRKEPATRDLLSRFNSLATTSFMTDGSIRDQIGTIEVGIPNQAESMDSLAAAYLMNCPLASFATRIPWNEATIHAFVKEIAECGTIEARDVQIENYSKLRHVGPDAPLWLDLRNSCQSGNDLLQNWPERFPHIQMCGNLPGQLRVWRFGTHSIKWIWDALSILDVFIESWRKDPTQGFSHLGLRSLGMAFEVSGESETVRNNPALRSAREFFLPSGEKRFFGDHIKFSGGIRLHFLFVPEHQCIYVGYLGAHLPL